MSLAKKFYGKVCMFRTYSAGVHFGTLIEKEGQEAHVKNSRRVWSWNGSATLSQLAMEGSSDIKNCKIAMIVSDIFLDQVIEVIPMTEKAIENLMSAEEWKA